MNKTLKRKNPAAQPTNQQPLADQNTPKPTLQSLNTQVIAQGDEIANLREALWNLEQRLADIASNVPR
jgi:uncharacterized coiled-coil protein SlyX